MLKYCCWSDDSIRVSVSGDRDNLSWAIFDYDGNIIKSCDNTSPWMPGLSSEEIAEARTVISSFERAPFDGVYLRFNNIPVSGKSKNHATGKDEIGVSCYEITWDLIAGCYKRCGSGLDGAAIAYLIQRAPIYFITGDNIGNGSDGEPLLANCRIVGNAVFDSKKEGYVLKK